MAQIVQKVAAEPNPAQRESYWEALLVLAGLRGLEMQVEEEAKRVPVVIDILENKVLGREYRRGHQEGERNLLRRMIEKRFGVLPESVSQRLDQLSDPELNDLGLRLLEVQSLEELMN